MEQSILRFAFYRNSWQLGGCFLRVGPPGNRFRNKSPPVVNVWGGGREIARCLLGAHHAPFDPNRLLPNVLRLKVLTGLDSEVNKAAIIRSIEIDDRLLSSARYRLVRFGMESRTSRSPLAGSAKGMRALRIHSRWTRWRHLGGSLPGGRKLPCDHFSLPVGM